MMVAFYPLALVWSFGFMRYLQNLATFLFPAAVYRDTVSVAVCMCM
jgi:hypothetical protein